MLLNSAPLRSCLRPVTTKGGLPKHLRVPMTTRPVDTPAPHWGAGAQPSYRNVQTKAAAGAQRAVELDVSTGPSAMKDIDCVIFDCDGMCACPISSVYRGAAFPAAG
jgi:hypothetical protein